MRFIATVWIIFAILGGCAVGALLSECSNKKCPPIVKVQYFKNGDTLYPNAICDQTMVVTNAAKLNDDMALIEQGYWDADEVSIDSLYHANCRSLNP